MILLSKTSTTGETFSLELPIVTSSVNDLAPGKTESLSDSLTLDAMILGSANLVSPPIDIGWKPRSWNDVSLPLILVPDVVLTLALIVVLSGKVCFRFGVIASN